MLLLVIMRSVEHQYVFYRCPVGAENGKGIIAEAVSIACPDGGGLGTAGRSG